MAKASTDPAWPEPGYWSLLLLPGAILLLGAFLVPGDLGTNEHGGDPRLEPEQPPPAQADEG